MPIPSDKKISGHDAFPADFCGVRATFLVVLGSEVLALLLTFGEGRLVDAMGEVFWANFSARSLFILWVGLLTGGLLCLTGKGLRRLDPSRAGLVAWLILLGVTVAVSVGVMQLGIRESLSLSSGESPTWFMIRMLVIAAITGALVFHYLSLQHQWHQQVRAESEARLRGLQARIRPHFLFNSLNTIAALARTRPELAEESLVDLAELFRAALQENEPLIPLSRELDIVQRYLHLESQRLGDRLRVVWRLDGVPEEVQVPPLSVQPLLENAVIHGVEPLLAPGPVEIDGHWDGRTVVLTLTNDCPPETRTGQRLALDNLRWRLAGFFGDAGGLHWGVREGRFEVRFIVPHPWVGP
ncbi:two-component system, LytTR family, sensor histidine kinase AlgZ [Gammaproteobacteria bacterium]